MKYIQIDRYRERKYGHARSQKRLHVTEEYVYTPISIVIWECMQARGVLWWCEHKHTVAVVAVVKVYGAANRHGQGWPFHSDPLLPPHYEETGSNNSYICTIRVL